MDAVDKAVVVSALEIAKFVLKLTDFNSTYDEDLFVNDILGHLDISDEEADILLDKITEMLGE